MGSVLSAQSLLNHDFDGEVLIGQQQKNQLIETALLFLNTPICGVEKPLLVSIVRALHKWCIDLMGLNY